MKLFILGSHTMWSPLVTTWFINLSNDSYLRTINHSWIGVMCANLAISSTGAHCTVFIYLYISVNICMCTIVYRNCDRTIYSEHLWDWHFETRQTAARKLHQHGIQVRFRKFHRLFVAGIWSCLKTVTRSDLRTFGYPLVNIDINTNYGKSQISMGKMPALVQCNIQ